MKIITESFAEWQMFAALFNTVLRLQRTRQEADAGSQKAVHELRDFARRNNMAIQLKANPRVRM